MQDRFRRPPRSSPSLVASFAAFAALFSADAGAQERGVTERPDFTGVLTWNLKAGENPPCSTASARRREP
jgi:hypothetical protein